MACWQVWLFPRIPLYHLQHFFIYPVSLYMLCLLLTRQILLRDVWARWRTYIPLALALLCVQSFAVWHYSPSETQTVRHLVMELFKISGQWPFLILFAELCRFSMQQDCTRRACLTGYLWASGGLLALCSVQGLYLYTAESSIPALNLFHDYSRTILVQVSPYLEARWPDAVYDFYSQGAYALSTQRMNGLFEEASSLAAGLATLFLPLSLGFLGLRGASARRPYLLGWLLSCTWIVLLFLARGTTGMLVAMGALVLLLVLSLGGKRKLWALGATGLCIGLCVIIALSVPHVATYLQHRTKYWNVIELPRVVIMLDTLDMINKHPWTGVGRGNFSAHIVQGERYRARAPHDLELQSWEKNGVVPPLSALLGFTAQYGIPLTLLLLGCVARIWFRIYRRWQAQPANPLLQYTMTACSAWCVLALIACVGSMDLRNPLFCLPVFAFMAIAQGADKAPEERKNAV